MPTSLAYSRKTIIHIFAQLKCKMRLQKAREKRQYVISGMGDFSIASI